MKKGEGNAMKKGKEWLKEAVGELNLVDTVFEYDGVSYIDTAVSVNQVYDLIDQMDEPEVLSHKWISDHIIFNDKEDAEYVYADKLQNLLVPKQEELESKIKVLIEAYKQEDGAYSNPENGWISGFVEDLENLVEEEQKYYVLDKEDATLLKKSAAGEGVAKSVGTNIYNVKSWKDEEKYQLTEQEIKNYDERFWPFAEPVE